VVDTSRIGVSGWSEGGLMTSWLIGHDHRWRAAVSGAAVNDWRGYDDMTDAKDFSPSFIGPSPWISEQMRALYAAESPLTDAAAVKTPTLIMTDAGDFRVPTPLSYEFYHAVRATGTPVDMVVFPGERPLSERSAPPPPSDPPLGGLVRGAFLIVGPPPSRAAGRARERSTYPAKRIDR
jgi:dipeptidyl aminopeptidase/acylaminoacyl peptidase